MAELFICDNCWENKYEMVWEHECQPEAHGICDCPCQGRRHITIVGSFNPGGLRAKGSIWTCLAVP